jgi:hypothetical protein
MNESRRLESVEMKDLHMEEVESSRHLSALFIGMYLHRTLTMEPTVVTDPPQRTEYTSKRGGGGTRWRSWFTHCATSRKVAVSIPDGVIEIFH